MSIAIGLATSGGTRWECTWSLVHAALAQAYDRFLVCPVGPYVDDGRNDLVRRFLSDTDCDKLLSLDSDISFSADDLAQLDADDLDCVSGVYYNVFGGLLKPVIKLLSNTEIVDEPIMEVAGVGAGFMMMSRALLEKMAAEHPEPQPWYHEPVVDGEHWGEDIAFCQRVRDLGVPVHIDLRVQVSHYKTVRIAGPDFGESLPPSTPPR